jgi:hypothetical protein
MMAVALVLLAAYVILAAWMGLWADRRFARHARLPMQWWLDGRPTWYAPRRLALILFPTLSGIGLLVCAVLIIAQADWPANMTHSPSVTLLFTLAAAGAALFAFYLWLVALWDRESP